MIKLPDPVIDACMDLIDIAEHCPRKSNLRKRLDDAILGISASIDIVQGMIQVIAKDNSLCWSGYERNGEYIIEKETPGGVLEYRIRKYRMRTE